LARCGTARQLPYDPFDPARAEGEEFGDVLAEGLRDLVRRRRSSAWPVAGEPAYWVEALRARRRLLGGIATRLAERRDGPTCAALRAVRAAERRRAAIDAPALAAYVRTWRADLRRWHTTLLDVHRDVLPDPTLRSPLRRLGLVGITHREGAVAK
jgi:DNA-binding GntR family transcriptional regulator